MPDPPPRSASLPIKPRSTRAHEAAGALPWRVLAAVGRGLRWALRGVFIVLLVIIPVPVISFLDKTKRRQPRNLPAQVVRDEKEP